MASCRRPGAAGIRSCSALLQSRLWEGSLFGYDTGVISGALLFIGPDLHASSFEQQAVVGALLLGAVAGAIVAGWAADALGRRRSTLIAGVIYIAGRAAVRVRADGRVPDRRALHPRPRGRLRVVRRADVHRRAGAEAIRGGMVSFNQLAIVSGILIAYIVNFAIKGVPSEWRWMLGLGAIPGAGARARNDRRCPNRRAGS